MPPELSIKVLVVDDSQATRELVCATLEELPDAEVTESATGFEALKVLPRQHFDLIITDINMPDINGLELINFVKKNPSYRDVPLFILSSEAREQDKQRGLALGASEYLTKPFEPPYLLDLVRRHLGLQAG